MATEAQIYSRGGEAQIFDSSPLIKQYQYQLAVAQKKRDEEDEAISKYVADLDADKVRDADEKEISNRYEGILNLNKEYVNAKDKATRLQLKSQITKQMQDLKSGISLSREAKDNEKALHQLTLNRNNNLVQGFTDRFGKLRTTSIFSPEYKSIAEDSVFSKPFAPDYNEDATMRRILDRSVNDVAPNVRAGKVAGLSGNFLLQDTGKQLNKEQFYQAFSNEMKTNDGLVYAIQKAGVNPQEYVDGLYKQYSAKYQPKTNYTASNWQPRQERSTDSNNELFRNVGTTNVPYGDPDSDSKDSKSSFDLRNTVPVSLPADDLIGQPAYNLTNQSSDVIPNVIGSARVVSIGEAPFIIGGSRITKKGKEVTEENLAGAIAQPGYIKKHGDKSVEWRPVVQVRAKNTSGDDVSYLVEPNLMPRSKQFVKALEAFEGSRPKTANKKNSSFDIEGYLKKKGLPK